MVAHVLLAGVHQRRGLQPQFLDPQTFTGDGRSLRQQLFPQLRVQAEKLAITRRIIGDIKDIWALQPRFEARAGKRPYALLEQPRFRAGYDFLLLRAESGEIDAELGRWWTDFLNADGETRAAMLLPQKPDEAKKRRRRKRKPAAAKASDANS